MTFFRRTAEFHRFLSENPLVVEALPYSDCFKTRMGAISPQLSLITRSGLARFLVCLSACGVVPNGSAGSVVYFNILQCMTC